MLKWVALGPSGCRNGLGVGNPAVSGRITGIAIASGGNRLYAATAGGGVFRSDDAGESWRPLPYDIAFKPSYPRFAVADEARVEIGVSALASGAIACHPVDPERVYVGTGELAKSSRGYRGVGIVSSADGGLTWKWEDVAAGGDTLDGAIVFEIALDPTNVELAMAATSRGLYRRTPNGSGGFHWEQRRLHAAGPAGSGLNELTSSVVVAKSGVTTAWFTVQRGGDVFRSTDGGATWPQAATGLVAAASELFTLAVKHDDPTLVYALGSSGKLQRADLSAAAPAWAVATNFPDLATGSFGAPEGERHQCLVVDPTQRDSVYFGGGRQRTIEGGVTAWHGALYRAAVNAPAAAPPVLAVVNMGRTIPAYLNCLAFPPGTNTKLWIGGDSGVFLCEAPLDAAPKLIPRQAGLAAASIRALAQHAKQENVLLAAVDGNGAQRYLGHSAWTAAYNGDDRYHHQTATHLGDALGVAINWHDPFQVLVFASPSTLKTRAAPPTTRPKALLIKKSDGGHNPDPPDAEEIVVVLDAGDAVEPFSPFLANPHETATAAEADRVAFATKQLWVSDNFRDFAKVGPALPSAAVSLAFASFDRLYVGCLGGEVLRFVHSGGAWGAPTRLDTQPGLPTGGARIQQPVKAIAPDPGGADRLYIAFGGRGVHDRVWHFDGANWTSRQHPAASAAEQLPQAAVNALTLDPTTPQTLFAGTDVGVWRSNDGGLKWAPAQAGMAEIPVACFLWFTQNGLKLLRAGTRGQGVFELNLGEADTPAVRLLLRDHRLDSGLRNVFNLPEDDPADSNAAPAARRKIEAADRKSLDISVDAPDINLRYRLASDACVSYFDFDGLGDEASQTAFEPGEEIVNRVYVQVHNRGSDVAHGVRVQLLVARVNAGAVPDLPNDYQLNLARGTPTDSDAWRTVGQILLDDVRSTVPGVARFELRTAVLARLGPLAENDTFLLLALLHHPEDVFASAEKVVTTLVDNARLAAQKLITLKRLRAALLPAALRELNRWKPIGPGGVRKGQARGKPVVSGRVPDIKVTPDGRTIYIASANAGVWRSDNNGRNWRSLSADFDDNPDFRQSVSVIAGGGIFAQDGLDSLATGALTIDPANPNRVFVGTGEAYYGYLGIGPLVCADTRASPPVWTIERAATQGGGGPPPPLAPLPMGGIGFFAMASDPANGDMVVGATTTGLFRRTPAVPGQMLGPVALAAGDFVWIRQTMPLVGPAPPAIVLSNLFTDVVVARAGGTTRFFTVGIDPANVPHVLISDNGGAWTEIVGYPANAAFHPSGRPRRVSLAVQETNITTLYAMDDFDPGAAGTSAELAPRIHRAQFTVAGGWVWVTLTNPPDNFFRKGGNNQGWYDQALAVAPDNINVIFAGGQFIESDASAIYRLTIAGTSITSAASIGGSAHPDVHALAIPTNRPRQLWAGCDGGVFFAADNRLNGDAVFAARNTGLQTLQFNNVDNHPTSETVLFGGTQDNGGHRYTGEETWFVVTGGDGGHAVVNQGDPHRYIIPYVELDLYGADNGQRADFYKQIPTLALDSVEFYPPFVRCQAAGANNLLAFGTQAVWLSSDFGREWRSIPSNSSPTDLLPATIRTICFATPTLLFAGTTSGEVHRYVQTGGTWQVDRIDNARPGGASALGGRDICAITTDPTQAGSIYVGLSGNAGFGRVWHFDATVHPPPPPPPPPPALPAADPWNRVVRNFPTGAPPNRDARVRALTTDPTSNRDLYIGTDIGVWQWQRPVGGLGAPPAPTMLSVGLPDSGVRSLVWHNNPPQPRLLRAATYGFGVWELIVGGAATIPAVELYLRNTQLDGGREGVIPPYGVADPTRSDKRGVAFGESPDIKIDSPNDAGNYQFAENHEVDFVEFVDRLEDRFEHVKVHEQPLLNSIYVQVHNRGGVAAPNVEVVALIGNNPPDNLPANWAPTLLAGNSLRDPKWSVIGRTRLHNIRAGHPQVARLEIPAGLLPRPADLDTRSELGLLVLVYDFRFDPLLGNEPSVRTLCDRHRQATFKRIKVEKFKGTLPRLGRGTRDFVPNLLPLVVALRTRARLTQLSTDLNTKLTTAGATVRDTERRVQALARRAQAMFDLGGAIPVPASAALAQNFSKFALLGTLAWDLADLPDILSPRPGWFGNLLRRGTPDGHFSKELVASGQFAARVGELALERAADESERGKIQAFVMGMMSALACHVVVNPLVRSMQRQRSTLDWDHDRVTIDEVLASNAIGRDLLAGLPGTERWQSLWPERGDIPKALFEGFAAALLEAYKPDEAKALRFKDTNPNEVDLSTPNADDLGDGYRFFRASMGSSSWAAWWALLLPILLMGPLALIIARYRKGDANAWRLFAEPEDDDPEGKVDEHSWYELIGTSLFTANFPPFIYAMILAALVPRQVPYFALAGISGVWRIAFGAAHLAEPKASGGVRWGLIFTGQILPDVGFLIASIVEAARGHGGHARLDLMQVIPAMTAGSNVLFGLLMHFANLKKEWHFWLFWALHTALQIFALGIGMGVLIANRGGLYGLLRNRVDKLPFDLLDPSTQGPVPRALGAVFDPQVGWQQGGTTLDKLRYPAERRAIARIWFSGNGELFISPDNDAIAFRHVNGGVTTNFRVLLDGPLTPAQIVQAITVGVQANAVADVHVELFANEDPVYPLPAPQTLADLGDASATHLVHDQAAVGFEKIRTSRDDAYLLRHGPRSALISEFGVREGCNGSESIRLLPERLSGSFENSGVELAAELGTLLCMGAVPSVNGADLNVAGVAANPKLGRVYQVFRQWNLDERSVNEWKLMVLGRAASTKPAPDQPDPGVRPVPNGYAPAAAEGEAVARNLGWLPALRAWTNVAKDPAKDTEAARAYETPVFQKPGHDPVQPTTARGLSAALRFLLDLA